MKATKIVMFMTLGAILFSSCAKDNTNPPNNKGVAVKFSSTLGGNLKTASLSGDSTTIWLNADQIGIYMVHNGTPLSANNIVSGADNIPYTAVPQSNATSADFNPSGNPIYYPTDASQQVNFIAYYPYSANQTGNFSYPINLTDQSGSTALADNDLLYARNNVAYDKGSGSVDLQFQHVLAKMVIQIRLGNGLTPADLDRLKVTIDGFQTEGSFDLASDTLRVTNSNDSLTAYTSPVGLLAQAILLPQSSPSSLTVNFQLANGDTYTWHPTPIQIDAANLYIYRVTIDKTGITATTGTIAMWRNVLAGGGTAYNY